MENKQRLPGIIFTRVLATIGIIFFHFFYDSKCSTKLLFQTETSFFGYIWVTCFFVISGAVLYYNYPKNFSLKTFYFKRWKSIFPIFYLSWLFWYTVVAISRKTLFWGGNPLKLILSFFGIDGYFYYILPNYYLVGEWFLGAIIFLYVLYPLLCRCINKNILIIPVIVLLVCIDAYTTKFLITPDILRPFIYIGLFYFGMIAMKYKNLFFDNKIVGLISLILFLFLCFVKVKIPCTEQIHGLFLFIVLIQIGNYIMKTSISSFFNFLDKISFPIFLFHHQIINVIFKYYNPSDIKYALLTLVFVIVISTICAKIFSNIINLFFKTKIFKNLESKFI